MDINELKAQAYDLLVVIQNAQNQLAQVNQAISQYIIATPHKEESSING